MILDFLSRSRRDGKVIIENLFHEFCETDLKSAPCSNVLVVGMSDLCVALLEHSWLPLSPFVQIVNALKDMFSKWRVTARQHEVIDVNQTQSMNDTAVLSESPQTGLHDGFLTFHVSKINRNTVVPSSWSIDKTVHGLQQSNALMMSQLQLSRQLGDWFTERVGNCLC